MRGTISYNDVMHGGEDNWNFKMVDASAGFLFNPGIRYSENGLVRGLSMKTDALASVTYNGIGYGAATGRGAEIGLIWTDVDTLKNAFIFHVDSIFGGFSLPFDAEGNLLGIVIGGASLGFSASTSGDGGTGGSHELGDTR